jgi:hypothetical protein
VPAPPRPARRRRLLLLLRLPSPSSGGRAGWLAAQRGSPEGEALRWLAGFLAEVDRGSPRNRMPARELAITLADGACVIAAWTSLSPPSLSLSLPPSVVRACSDCGFVCPCVLHVLCSGHEIYEHTGGGRLEQPAAMHLPGRTPPPGTPHGRGGGGGEAEPEGAPSAEQAQLWVMRFLQHAIAVMSRRQRSLVALSPGG